jgi:hypothetical protein
MPVSPQKVKTFLLVSCIRKPKEYGFNVLLLFVCFACFPIEILEGIILPYWVRACLVKLKTKDFPMG